MHVYLTKSSRFESTDFATIMIDDVGISVPSVMIVIIYRTNIIHADD